ncbi:hypothetical protein KZX06_08500 [Micrococcus sp. EYE_162]|uniref:general stress protein n=1 Tax=unclassified Micrococcus TaxID=2620948 RepID=UPI0020064D1F|nr:MULTISPECIES: general stress protein [unclassified Micrococcus]MCK6095976.1 hypothetical protein [Micrococcus sp. EYE_212]MCK6172067.1 hypothetical protein [Micrococcus sp. EYE_162]
MSFMMSSPAPGSGDTGLPRGELVATYSTYTEAREQVDRLAATDFPVSAVSIVGKDLRVVERVRGRLNYAQVALGAGVRGLMFGALIGAFLLLLDPSGGPLQILTSALLGLAVWLLFGVIGFALRKGRHGFASSQAVVPAGYDLVIAFEHAARARQELGLTARPAPAAPAPAAPAPITAAPDQAAPADHDAGTPAPSAPAGTPAAPAGLDRSYGVSLPPEEVARLIEARGGRPGPQPPSEGGSHRA